MSAEINALYWTFTRTARGVPPVVARPDLYARRTEIEAQVRRLRGRRKPEIYAARSEENPEPRGDVATANVAEHTE